MKSFYSPYSPPLILSRSFDGFAIYLHLEPQIGVGVAIWLYNLKHAHYILSSLLRFTYEAPVTPSHLSHWSFQIRY